MTVPHPPIALRFDPVVVIPTFDHGASLPGVLDGLARLGLRVIVVDDGSTDGTPSVLGRWIGRNPHAPLKVVGHSANRGKADALRTGFETAESMGATHAVTIDADGQLDPADIPCLLAHSRSRPLALVLGARAARIEGCPGRCLLGRRLANLAIRGQTGLRLTDSQCGLRVYPLDLVRAIRCGGGRFEFEAEIITRAHWAGFPVVEAPVTCRYFAGARRRSHFRPWRDSLVQAVMHAGLLARRLARTTAERHGVTASDRSRTGPSPLVRSR